MGASAFVADFVMTGERCAVGARGIHMRIELSIIPKFTNIFGCGFVVRADCEQVIRVT